MNNRYYGKLYSLFVIIEEPFFKVPK